jgi:hypothetical protein
MVWLFDATERFRMVESGPRVFFSLGRVKHIERCQKPVFLDFGPVIVQVENFTTKFWKCSGFGLARDRRWFVEQYLSQKTLGGGIPPTWVPSPGEVQSNPWEKDCPYSTTWHPTRWMMADGELRLPGRTKHLPLNYSWRTPSTGHTRPVWQDIIDLFPGLANGWTEGSLHEMKEFLNATPMIFEGLLRLMPSTDPSTYKPGASLSVAQDLLRKAEAHIAGGRIPVLKSRTKEQMLERARATQAAREGPSPPF